MFCNTSFGSGGGYPNITNFVGTHQHNDDIKIPKSNKNVNRDGKRKNEFSTPTTTVAKILEKIASNNKHLVSNLNYNQRSVLSQISKCAKEELGYVMSICDQCGHNQIVASCKCNDRHCPSCGATKRKEWLKKFSERNFATSNFHAVFTLPHELNSIIQQFPSQLLALLCKEAAKDEYLRDYSKARDKYKEAIVLLDFLSNYSDNKNPDWVLFENFRSETHIRHETVNVKLTTA